jgi:hypothetical protein
MCQCGPAMYQWCKRYATFDRYILRVAMMAGRVGGRGWARGRGSAHGRAAAVPDDTEAHVAARTCGTAYTSRRQSRLVGYNPLWDCTTTT